jgi:hypothetical protein
MAAVYSFALQINAADSSETLVTIYQTIRRHIPEEIILRTFYLLIQRIIRLILLNVVTTAEPCILQ